MNILNSKKKKKKLNDNFFLITCIWMQKSRIAFRSPLWHSDDIPRAFLCNYDPETRLGFVCEQWNWANIVTTKTFPNHIHWIHNENWYGIHTVAAFFIVPKVPTRMHVPEKLFFSYSHRVIFTASFIFCNRLVFRPFFCETIFVE